MGDIKFGYDFWYQPRHNIMVSSEWAAPNAFMPGFDLEEVGHLKYGRELHFGILKKRAVESFYLGEDGLLPLEVKFHPTILIVRMGFAELPYQQMSFIGGKMRQVNGNGKRSLMLKMNYTPNGRSPCRRQCLRFWSLWMINIFM